MTGQIFFGSIVLGLCSAIHIAVLISAISLLLWIGRTTKTHAHVLRSAVLFVTAFAAVVFAHTIQVWVWAAAFMMLGAITNVSDAIYFSIVTYTTLGYGDITLDPEFRIFGAMASVTGLLNFGLSTAFLVRLMATVFPAIQTSAK